MADSTPDSLPSAMREMSIRPPRSIPEGIEAGPPPTRIPARSSYMTDAQMRYHRRTDPATRDFFDHDDDVPRPREDQWEPQSYSLAYAVSHGLPLPEPWEYVRPDPNVPRPPGKLSAFDDAMYQGMPPLRSSQAQPIIDPSYAYDTTMEFYSQLAEGQSSSKGKERAS